MTIMTAFPRYQLQLLLSLLFLALISAEGPKAGDAINWATSFPQWWHDLKEAHESREIRKCVFLVDIPDTGASCPGVSQRDHYYCVFGNQTAATWFCTCIEKQGEYGFHCGDHLKTVEEITALQAEELAKAEALAQQQKENEEKKLKEDSSFVGGLFTGIALMAVGLLAFFVIQRHRRYRKQPVATHEGQVNLQGAGLT
eukprot:CAMPEP_0119003130 /NCGR_PEP_ID=MMETSP1176-20130426/376_1 /TAXON_ID=265551 /ORGANISM="Synedropsis recta cf, Strain CCMP1620" /LENGTH=198 /DNA_ID=CAMNT_0006954699 /DNA_START=22 /DNA_END=618 /DNA_ORIENTATION=+